MPNPYYSNPKYNSHFRGLNPNIPNTNKEKFTDLVCYIYETHEISLENKKNIYKLLDNINKLIEEEVDFKSRLIIWCQKKHLALEFFLVNETKQQGINKYDIEVRINQATYGAGTGGNKKEAEQNAAKELTLFSTAFHSRGTTM